MALPLWGVQEGTTSVCLSVGSALAAVPTAPSGLALLAAVPTQPASGEMGRLRCLGIPRWKVPGAGQLEYRSSTPPPAPDCSRRCLTTSVLALELKVMPVSFLHVFLHVSLPQSSSISPRKWECSEGPAPPTQVGSSGPGVD